MVSGADRRFEVDGLERAGWRTSAPIRAIFRKASQAAGVPYFNPHSFRYAIWAFPPAVLLEAAGAPPSQSFSQEVSGGGLVRCPPRCYAAGE